VPLLLFLAILLVAGLAFNIAHLDTGGEQLPASPGSGSPTANPQGILDSNGSAFLLVATIAALVTAGVILFFLRRKGERAKRPLRPTTWADVVATLIAFVLFASLIYLWPRLVGSANRQNQTANTTGAGGGAGVVIPSVSGIPLGVFLAGAVFASILAIALFFHVGANLRRMRPMPSLGKDRQMAVQAVQDAIAELQLGADVRTAILACYQRFCLFLGARGIESQESLTPRELEDLATEQLRVSPDSAEILTSLFEEARYSEHALGDGDRERAVRSLERIRADLEA
jgi:hypothetical protein